MRRLKQCIQFDDGREVALLHFIYNHPKLSDMRGNPQGVLDAIDEYGKTKKYLMNVGEHKSKIVVDLIKAVKPRTMVELGGYVGYSAIAFGAAFKEAGGTEYYSLEYNPEFGAVIASLIDLAGLHDVVRVEIGPASSSLRRLHAEGTLKKIDLMFLDHVKPLYTPDLKLCEELGLVGVGSVLAADNGELARLNLSPSVWIIADITNLIQWSSLEILRTSSTSGAQPNKREKRCRGTQV